MSLAENQVQWVVVKDPVFAKAPVRLGVRIGTQVFLYEDGIAVEVTSNHFQWRPVYPSEFGHYIGNTTEYWTNHSFIWYNVGE